MDITIYTDGSIRKKLKAGGWGFVAFDPVNESQQIRECGKVLDTTSQRMEMTAIIEALKLFSDKPFNIKIVSDSKYCVDGINIWIHNWIKQGWKNYAREPVKNMDLWKIYYHLFYNSVATITAEWVKGHSNHQWNDIADELARIGVDGK